jgi:16S rRNA (uracil1498-N3)-methyltransferase
VRRRFFVEKFQDDKTMLRGESAEHLGRVLRAESGQLFELSDGHRVWLARVEHVVMSKRQLDSRVDFSLVEPIEAREPSLKIQLLMSIVKFDRLEWCLEKATELGVTEVVPLAAGRSEKALVAAAAKRGARWQRIMVESAQQARRLRPPVLMPLLTAEQALTENRAACKIVLSERSDARHMGDAFSSRAATADAALAIGPEGGWTEGEIAAARGAGFIEASLGENILRTETAVIASLAILRFVAGA